MTKRTYDIVAISSSGGHWEQLLLAMEKVDSNEVLFVTTNQKLIAQNGFVHSRTINDCSRSNIIAVIECIYGCARIIFSARPKLVISTGAAPGIIGILFGRVCGAKTIWIDSFANVEKLSLSGKIARYLAHIWLTQWEHLSADKGPIYKGQLL